MRYDKKKSNRVQFNSLPSFFVQKKSVDFMLINYLLYARVRNEIELND